MLKNKKERREDKKKEKKTLENGAVFFNSFKQNAMISPPEIILVRASIVPSNIMYHGKSLNQMEMCVEHFYGQMFRACELPCSSPNAMVCFWCIFFFLSFVFFYFVHLWKVILASVINWKW